MRGGLREVRKRSAVLWLFFRDGFPYSLLLHISVLILSTFHTSPVKEGEVGWFNHCMVYFLSSLPLILLLLLVSASILALSTVLCRAENQYNSNIFIFICSDCYIYLVLCNFPAPGSALLLGKQPGVLPAKEAEGKAITSICFQCMTNSETFNGASMQWQWNIKSGGKTINTQCNDLTPQT